MAFNVNPTADVTDSFGKSTNRWLKIFTASLAATPASAVTALTLDQNNDAVSLIIDSEATTSNAMTIDSLGTGIALRINQVGTGSTFRIQDNGVNVLDCTDGGKIAASTTATSTFGYSFVGTGALSGDDNNSMFYISASSSSSQGTLLHLNQSGTTSSNILVGVSAQTSGALVRIDNPSGTTMTAGNMLALRSLGVLNSGCDGLLVLINDASSAGSGFKVDHNGNGTSIEIDSEATSATVFNLVAANTSGTAMIVNNAGVGGAVVDFQDGGTSALKVVDGGQVSFTNYNFPVADGTVNQVLETDGAGVLSFVAQSGGGGLTLPFTDTDASTTAANIFGLTGSAVFTGTNANSAYAFNISNGSSTGGLLFLQNLGTGKGIDLRVSSTSSSALSVTSTTYATGNFISANSTALTTGSIAKFNTANATYTGTNGILNVQSSNASSTGTLAKLDQDGNGISFNIESVATTKPLISSIGTGAYTGLTTASAHYFAIASGTGTVMTLNNGTGTGTILRMQDNGVDTFDYKDGGTLSLTTTATSTFGYSFLSTAVHTGTGNNALFYVKVDNASSTGELMRLANDGTLTTVLNITSAQTTSNVMTIDNDSGTTFDGAIVGIRSLGVLSAGGEALQVIVNDATSAGVGIEVNQKGTGSIVDFQDNGTTMFEVLDGGNTSFFSAGSFGGGTKVLFIANATGLPGGTPTGGGLLYVNAGALTWKGSSGTVTVLGVA